MKVRNEDEGRNKDKLEMKIKQPLAKSPDGRSGIIRNEGTKTPMRKLERYIGLTRTNLQFSFCYSLK